MNIFIISTFYNFYKYINRDNDGQSYMLTNIKVKTLYLFRNGASINSICLTPFSLIITLVKISDGHWCGLDGPDRGP